MIDDEPQPLNLTTWDDVMSIDIDWETLTTGSDGLALAERIRGFIHDKFQQVTLPRFIRSVQVHSFEFGTAAPEVELKDICDPLPDFYEEEDDDEDDDSEESDHREEDEMRNRKDLSERRQTTRTYSSFSNATTNTRPPPYIDTRLPGLRLNLGLADHIASPLLSRSNTPGITGGTSNLGYFHLPLGTGLSGSQTPLAAVAGGGSFSGAWPDHFLPHGEGSHHGRNNHKQEDFAFADPSTRPSTAQSLAQSSLHEDDATSRNNSSTEHAHTPEGSESLPSTKYREKRPEDVQIVSRVRYSGDIKLSLTAEILLDYPMPSFVGIPLKLNITGLSFDGVAVIAYIRKRAHFCFLSPEDADVSVGAEQGSHMEHNRVGRRKVGGLLQEIKVESEIGQKESGKQVLKNVGKVEKFVLEQVRGIFEDEFVYPSFWTFLV